MWYIMIISGTIGENSANIRRSPDPAALFTFYW